MKKRFIGTVALSLLLLAGCGGGATNSGSEGLVQIDEDVVNQLVEGEKDGFFLAVSDKEEYFMETLKEVAENEGATINYYYTWQPDGVDGEKVDSPVVEAINKFDLNRLYYVKDGEELQYIRLSSYKGVELQEQIQAFIQNFAIHEK